MEKTIKIMITVIEITIIYFPDNRPSHKADQEFFASFGDEGY